MTRIAHLAATVVFLATSAAQAAIDPAALGRQWFAEGYSAVEVTVGRSQVKVEGIRGGQKVEAVYDSVTGAILKQEAGATEAEDDIRNGILVRQRDRDFVRVSAVGRDDSSDDDGNDDDRGRGRGRGSDDSGSDDRGGRGSDDGANHDNGDDHGGNRGGDDNRGSNNSGRGGSDD
ncbi:PepSY domain-containing protein [Neotabrizicola shimadae]|uniref:PepSY domain-containing protein n=1 Tax=Neotabrizicola shimadae TaxID=2807096 RepID=A0A8G0ZZ54_9RHOB|nr:PepSY domain-containing protein [Neotabrizicola shimadae]QYZ71736.1 PepSY domain-containing protein [Neotabrizicola shimadae]